MKDQLSCGKQLRGQVTPTKLKENSLMPSLSDTELKQGAWSFTSQPLKTQDKRDLPFLFQLPWEVLRAVLILTAWSAWCLEVLV